jgi:dGTPase
VSGSRQHSEQPRSTSRDPFERDRDRVLYSVAFRRLAGVTQVAAAHERPLLHNRLTHSLKVAQIGRRMSQRLISVNGGDPNLRDIIDPDVVETAGLAHDLGHPPFGHSAEEVLDERLADCGGFEGNAQSLRIVSKYHLTNFSYPGLNLTDRSLNAILKYPCFRDERSKMLELLRSSGQDSWHNRSFGTKWGAYHYESSTFEFARQRSVGRAEQTPADKYSRTPESIIMDWADDVSFATHDVDDYYRAGLIPLHNLHQELPVLVDYAAASMGRKPGFERAKLEQAFTDLDKTSSSLSEYQDSPIDRANAYAFTNTVLDVLLQGLVSIDSPPWVQVSEDAQYTAEALKAITKYYVIESAATAIARKGHTNLVAALYDQLVEWLSADPASPRSPRLLRSMYAESLDDGETFPADGRDELRLAKRVVADYMCALTETQTIDMAQRFSGITPASMFGSWF